MSKLFWFALDGDVIIDAVDYAVTGYTKVVLPLTHLPAGINAGYYRWTGTVFERDNDLYGLHQSVLMEAARQDGRNEVKNMVIAADEAGSIIGQARTKLLDDGIF